MMTADSSIPLEGIDNNTSLSNEKPVSTRSFEEGLTGSALSIGELAVTRSVIPIEMEDVSASLPSEHEIRGDIAYRGYKKSAKRRWIVRGLVALVLFFVLVVVVATSTALAKRAKRSEPTQSPRVTTFAMVVNFLKSEGMASESLTTSGTPQEKAARWLAEQDPANILVPSPDTAEHEKFRYMVRYVMALFYYALEGENWHQKNEFLTGSDICFWHHPFLFTGLYCTKFSEDPRMMPVYLSLNSNNLNGRIPSEIGLLSQLHTVSLQNNELSGKIPTNICEIDDLAALALNTNELTGPIPSCLEQVTNLKQLYLTKNRLDGSIPSELCKLTNLEQLSLGDNKFTQHIPSCFKSLTKVNDLRLEKNELNGEIPSALCELSAMSLLSLGWNMLTGKIPACLGTTHAKEIYLHTNKLSGFIPTALCDNSNLIAFQASVNTLTGKIPACFGDLDMRVLSLSDNFLEGSLPTELGKASNLSLLYIDDNMLTGDPTITLTNFVQATQVFANNNYFSGEITSSFMNASKDLNYLDLSSNGFTSTNGIPKHLFNLRHLDVLDVSSNMLAGPIDDNISPNNELKLISAYNNKLSGPVPTTLRNLGLLSHLDISNNTFTGEMPSFIGTMSQLRILFLSENNFTAGPIPMSYSNLRLLQEMSIRNTHRNGKLPEFLGQLTRLNILDVGNNDLSGTIPASFGNLTLLSFLLLNDNLIEGAIPNSLSKLSDLSAAYFDGTRLSGDLAELCKLPNFVDSVVEVGERIVADCLPSDGNDAGEIVCSCCRCCPAQQQGGCSNPDLENIDVRWEDTFRRQNSKIDYGGQNETVPAGSNDILEPQ